MHRIKTLTKRSTMNLSLDQLIHALNPILRGWTNYHRHNASKRCFAYLSYYLWWRVIRWLRKKYPRLTWKQIKRRCWGRNWTSREGTRLALARRGPGDPIPLSRPPHPLTVGGGHRNRTGPPPGRRPPMPDQRHDRPTHVLWRAGCSGMGTSGSEGRGEQTTARKRGTGGSPRPCCLKPNLQKMKRRIRRNGTCYRRHALRWHFCRAVATFGAWSVAQ